MDILLVLGSVTPTEFEPVRRKMLDAGMNPIVCRITDHASNSSFFDELSEAEEEDADFNLLMLSAAQAQGEFLEHVLNGATVSEIRGFVLPTDASTETDWQWVTSQIAHDAIAYQVHLNESDGTPFLVGAGFGQTLEIS